MSFYPDGLRVRFASCLLGDQSRNWWEEVGHALGAEVGEAMSLSDFVSRFRA